MLSTFHLIQSRRRMNTIVQLAATRRRPKPGPTPKWRYPHRVELAYTQHLFGFVDSIAAAVDQELIPQLASLYRQARPLDSLRTDDWTDDLAAIFAKLRARLAGEAAEEEETADDTADQTSDFNREQFSRVLAKIGVDVFAAEPDLVPVMQAWTHENVSLIKSIPEKSLSDVESLVYRAFRTGLRPEELAKDIQARFGVAKSRAKIIARDQIGNLNGDLTRERQLAVGISEYEWDTAGDERVRGRPGGHFPHARPSHWAMQGKICRWDDATVYRDEGSTEWKPRSLISGPTQHPGQPILCRCVGHPRLENLLEGL